MDGLFCLPAIILVTSGDGALTFLYRIAVAIKRVSGENGLACYIFLFTWSSSGVLLLAYRQRHVLDPLWCLLLFWFRMWSNFQVMLAWVYHMLSESSATKAAARSESFIIWLP